MLRWRKLNYISVVHISLLNRVKTFLLDFQFFLGTSKRNSSTLTAWSLLQIHYNTWITQRLNFIMISFSRSEWISRDNDVTIVFVPLWISALRRIFSGNVLGYVFFGACLLLREVSQKSICEESVKISYLLDVSGKILLLIRFKNVSFTSRTPNRSRQLHMCDFEKQKCISSRVFENVIAKWTFLCRTVFKVAIIKSMGATTAFSLFLLSSSSLFLSPPSFSFVSVICSLSSPKNLPFDAF